MSEIRTGLEVIEQAIYEILGLAVPGAAAVGGLACVISPEDAPRLFTWAGQHELAALTMVYVAGYVVQSASRPVTNLTRAILGVPMVFARKVGALDRAARAVASFWSRMTSGHRPHRSAHDGSTSTLPDLVRESWEQRLGLAATDQHLRDCDAFDLAYSTLGAAQRRLSRLRAFVSLCRAMAAICAAAFWGLLGLVALHPPPTWTGAGLVVGLWLIFTAFMERADMYDALWKGIVPAQFLADASSSVSAATRKSVDVAGGFAQSHDISPLAPPTSARALAGDERVPASVTPHGTRDEAPSPASMSGAKGTAPNTGIGGPLA